MHRPHKFLAVGAIAPHRPHGVGAYVSVLYHQLLRYEPTRSAMQTSICQKRPIFRIPYFRPSKCRPWNVPPGANAPPRPPLPHHWTQSKLAPSWWVGPLWILFCCICYYDSVTALCLLVMSAAASRIVDRSPHQLCGQELNVSLVTGLGDKCNIFSVDEVLDTEALSCAIELRDIAPNMTEEILSMFFQNRKRSGGDEIEDMFFSVEEHRAVITFANPEGCIVHL